MLISKICLHSCLFTHTDTLKATFRNTIFCQPGCEIMRIVWEEHRAPARVLHHMATDAEDHVWRIERWRLGFRPQAYFPQQSVCEMTWHVASPPHPRAPPPPPPVENAMLDKGVCGDEWPIECLAKVTVLQESPFCPLISIWKNTTFGKRLVTHSKGRIGGTKFFICFRLCLCYFLGMACCQICDKTCWNHPVACQIY